MQWGMKDRDKETEVGGTKGMCWILTLFYFRDLKEALGKEIKDREAEAKLLKNLITDNAKVRDTLIAEFWLGQKVLKNTKSWPELLKTWNDRILTFNPGFRGFWCKSLDLKVPSGQIGSKWEWYHWIALEKDINRYKFWIFYFRSWIF